MIHLKTTCDQRRKKKDGTLPIVFRITVNGESRDISTGLSCDPLYWDFRKNSVKEKREDLRILNNRIKDQELDLLEKIRKFEQESSSGYDVREVKDFICNRSGSTPTVENCWLEEIERMKRAQKFSNARNYRSALLGLQKVVSLQIQFQKVNYAWLVNVETILRANGLKETSISIYLRTLRSIYNRAINMGLVDYNNYPFRRYHIPHGVSSPRSLTIIELRRFFSYKPTNDRMKYAHDLGKLILLLRGMNFTDLALLTKDNVKNGRIVYNRSKTKKRYSVQILPEAQAIIDAYPSDSPVLLLRILTDDEHCTKKSLPLTIQERRKILNKWLRRIGVVLGIREPLSTYVFRYSFGCACRELGYSKDMISQALGHSYGLRVTDAYLNDIDAGLIDEMNRRVVVEVMKEGG